MLKLSTKERSYREVATSRVCFPFDRDAEETTKRKKAHKIGGWGIRKDNLKKNEAILFFVKNRSDVVVVGSVLAIFVDIFFFVCFVLQIVKHNGAKETPVNGLAIGLALYAAIQIASGISGGCINPAVGLVQTVFQRLFNGHAYPNAPPQQLMYMPIYLISPFIGGMVAGFFQRVFVQIAYDRAERVAQDAE